MSAAEQGDRECVELLLAAGSDSTLVDDEGATALHRIAVPVELDHHHQPGRNRQDRDDRQQESADRQRHADQRALER